MNNLGEINTFFLKNSFINNKPYLEENISFDILVDNLINNRPKSLFKYFSDEEYNQDSILNNTVYCNNPKNFNDPYDCGLTEQELIQYKRNIILFLLEYSGIKDKTLETKEIDCLIHILAWVLCTNNLKFKNYSNNECIKLQLELFERKLRIIAEKEAINKNNNPLEIWNKVINEYIDDKLNDKFITCFSATNNNLLLWSHYACKHTGYCLEYDISTENNILLNLFPVIYSLNKKKASDILYNYLLNIQKECGNLYTNFLLRKSYHWMYENEWRLIVNSNMGEKCNDGVLVKFTPLKAIYFGLNMSPNRKQELYCRFKDKNIKFYTMSMDEDSYNVTFKEYSL